MVATAAYTPSLRHSRGFVWHEKRSPIGLVCVGVDYDQNWRSFWVDFVRAKQKRITRYCCANHDSKFVLTSAAGRAAAHKRSPHATAKAQRDARRGTLLLWCVCVSISSRCGEGPTRGHSSSTSRHARPGHTPKTTVKLGFSVARAIVPPPLHARGATPAPSPGSRPGSQPALCLALPARARNGS